MTHRRDHRTWSLWRDGFDFGELFGGFTLIWLFGVGGLVCLLGGSVGYAASIETHDTAANARASIVKVVNTAGSTTESRDVANAMLLLERHKTDTLIGNAADTPAHRSQTVAALQETARTGAPLVLDTRQTGWGPYWAFWFWLWLGIFFGGYSAALFILYVYVSDNNGHYLSDLPWRRVWPIFFVILTALPIGLPFYVASAIRLHSVPPLPQPRRYDRYDPYYYEPPRPQRHLTVREQDVRRAADVKFGNEPQSARQFYTDLRLTSGKRMLIQKRDRLRDSVKQREQTLRNLGTQTRDENKLRAAEMAELKIVEELAKAKDETKALDVIDAEFTALMTLNGVVAARVVNDMLSVRINVRVPYAGIRYDFGDWEVRVSKDGSYSLDRLRSGVRDSWTGHYPDYSYPSGGFCLGDRESAIRNNIAKGQTLEGLELISATLHSVNAGDKAKIPLAFRKDKG